MSLKVLLLSSIPVISALQWEDGTGKLPALGWNSWNAYGCDIDETKVLEAAQGLVDFGFKDAGYEYVNIDDCWSIKDHRDPDTDEIIPDPDKFPSGISGVADKVHDMGLKLGIYSSAGTATCAGYPASIGYEEIDAASWAAWGVDYLKYDNCNIPDEWHDECDACVFNLRNPDNYNNGTCTDGGNYCPDGYDYTKSNSAKRYQAMRDALQAQNRTILYSLCSWGSAGVEQYGNATGNSWRMSDDIQDNWDSVVSILNMNSFIVNDADFWGHPDPDMLEVGNGGLSTEEERTHFAFWAAMKSPLLIGTDLNAASNESKAIMLNKYLIAFNQDDVYGAAAKPYKWGTNPDYTFDPSHPAEFWSGESQLGTFVFMLNSQSDGRSMTVDFAEVPGLDADGEYDVLDVWSDDSLGSFTSEFEIDVSAHDTAVLLFTPSS
ncbi:glycoside hydrolase family 27 protein [Poronia punctata]|nr:glycoside hydrolase family 27 protein [Poronia punctata]